jgi:hypothetical protein
MKFKTIFALFNAILIFSFAFIFFMPFLLLGAEYSMPFWAKNWPLFMFFTAVLIGFNIFFISNWRLFTLLESEDWEALGSLLETRVFEKKRYDRRTVRLLVNTALLRGDMVVVEKLESVLRQAKPVALRRDAVLFGAARLLQNDAQASVLFLGEFADGKGVENPAWIIFYHAFALVLVKRALEAAPMLEASLGSRDYVLAVLSAYLLGTLCAPAVHAVERERLVGLAEATRAALFKRFGAIKWAREVERAKSEIHVVILSRILDEASAWLLKIAPAV